MSKAVLKKENIVLSSTVSDKTEAIRLAGEVLVSEGYVEPSYVEKMLEREELTSTYMGNFVAIPHGTESSRDLVKSAGISVIQIPEGVDFGDGNVAKVLIGIAGKNNEHLEILSKIAIVCSEEENIQKIVEATSKEDILSLLGEVN